MLPTTCCILFLRSDAVRCAIAAVCCAIAAAQDGKNTEQKGRAQEEEGLSCCEEVRKGEKGQVSKPPLLKQVAAII